MVHWRARRAFVIYKEIEEKVIQKVNDMWKLVIVEFFWAALSSEGKMEDERERTFPKKQHKEPQEIWMYGQ